MIFSAIISTLSIEALPHVIGLSTSSEVCHTLETLFSAQSQSRIMQLSAFFSYVVSLDEGFFVTRVN